MALIPRRPVPTLELPTLAGQMFELSKQHPETFSMIVFYRGLHCPVCRRYLSELDGMLDEFGMRGVVVCVASSDTRERAEQTRVDWGLKKINLAYALAVERRGSGAYTFRAAAERPVAVLRSPSSFPSRDYFL